jgi:hypothetical protein
VSPAPNGHFADTERASSSGIAAKGNLEENIVPAVG